MSKTTKAQFERFKKECRRCIDILELNDWRVVFKHEDLGEDNATIGTSPENCIALIRFSADIQPGETPEELARHEIGHLLITRLRTMALTRFTSEQAIETEDERLAVTISRLLK